MLELDLRIAYSAGAWVSVVVLACAAVEAQIRQVFNEDYSNCLSDITKENPDVDWLRSLRNEIMHAKEPGTPSLIWKIDGHDLGTTHQSLENEAVRAVEIMFRTIYPK